MTNAFEGLMGTKPAVTSEVPVPDPSASGDPAAISVLEWAIGAVSIAVGLLALAFPTQLIVTAAVWALAALSVCLCLLASRDALRARVPGKAILMGSVFVFFWLEALLMVLHRPIFSAPHNLGIPGDQFSPKLVATGLTLCALFQILLLLSYAIPKKRLLALKVPTRLSDPEPRLLRVAAYALAGLSLAPLVVAYGFNPWTVIRAIVSARTGTVRVVYDIGPIWYFTELTLFAAALLLCIALTSRGRASIAPAVVALVTAIPAITGGARHLALFIFLPPLFLLLRRQRALRAWHGITLAIGAVLALVAIMQLEFMARGTGWNSLGVRGLVDLLDGMNLGQFTSLLFAIHLVPSIHPFFHESVIPYFFIHWIPRFIWPTKPVMAAWQYYNDAYVQGAAYNVTPSIIGQYYINWGVAGVLVPGLLLGGLAGISDRVLAMLEPDRHLVIWVLASMFVAFIVSSFRFLSPIYVTYFVLACVAAVPIFVLGRARRSRRAEGVQRDSSEQVESQSRW